MAGWDGDALAGKLEEALERQQEAAEARRARTTDASSPKERESRAREESVRLSRARLAEQLVRATNPAHRLMLERALEALAAETTDNESPVRPGRE